MSQNWSSKSAWVPTWQDFHFGASSQSRKASQIFPHLRSDLKDLFRHSSMQRTTPPKALTAHQVMPHIPPSLWVWVWAVVFVQEAPGSSDDPKGRLPGEALVLAARGCANEAAKAAQRAMFTAVVRASWKPDLCYTNSYKHTANIHSKWQCISSTNNESAMKHGTAESTYFKAQSSFYKSNQGHPVTSPSPNQWKSVNLHLNKSGKIAAFISWHSAKPTF